MSELDGLEGIADAFPATGEQAGLLFETLSHPGSAVNLGLITLDLPVDVDEALLKRAFEDVLARHDALRSHFLWEGLSNPVQIVREVPELPWDQVTFPSRAAQAVFAAHLARDGLDLSAPLPMRLVFCTSADRATLIWLVHHALIDDWSAKIVLDEVAQSYAGAPISPPPTQFRAYVDWLAGRDEPADHSFWATRLANLKAPTAFYLPAPLNTSSPERIKLSVEFTTQESSEIHSFARSQRVTIAALLATAWGVILHRYGCGADPVFGLASTQRHSQIAGIDRAVGHFVGVAPIVTTLSGAQSPLHLLHAMQDQIVTGAAYPTPLPSALGRLAGLDAQTPLFDTILAVNETPSWPALFTKVEVQNFSSFPFAVIATPSDILTLTALADASRFDAAHVKDLLDAFKRVLLALPSTTDVDTRDLPVLDSESAPLAVHGDFGMPLPPALATLPDRFATSAKNHPDRDALICENQHLSYADLSKRTDQIAAAMTARGLVRGARVAVLLERGPGAIACFLAAWRCGASYIPLDPDAPKARLNAIIAQAGVDLVLTTRAFTPQVGETPHLTIDSTLASDPAPVVPTDPDAPAYVMFTSGSTGAPKGVIVSHDNLAASTHARSIWYGQDPVRFMVVSPLGFDSSVAGLYWSLATGGTVVLPARAQIKEPTALIKEIKRLGITHILCLPSLYEVILSLARAGDLASLGCVIVAGEPASQSVIAKHAQLLPNVRLVNEFGPTEATVWCAAAVLDDPAGPVPIGRAIPGSTLVVRDENLRPVPDGVPGHLWVGGRGVAQGYLNQPALSAARFLTDQRLGAGRFYDTGDLVRRAQNGALSYIGRADGQIKIRGQRIEPQEVETKLALCQNAGQLVVVATARPTLRVVWTGQATQDDLHAYAIAHLTTAMVPSEYHRCETLPLTPNGKLDRNALAAMDIAPSDVEASSYESHAQAKLAEIFQEVLGLNTLPPPDTDIFALGGDSLRLMRLSAAVSQAFETPLTVAALARIKVSVSGVAKLLAQGDANGAPLVKHDPQSANAAQAGIWFASKLHAGQPFFNLSAGVRQVGDLSQDLLDGLPAALVAKHPILANRFSYQKRALQLLGDGAVPVVLAEDIDEQELPAWSQRITEAPFDVDEGPLWRVAIARLPDGDVAVLVVIHHAIADGWSLDLLMKDTMAYLASQNLDAACVKEVFQPSTPPQALDFWHNELDGLPQTQLPYDKPKPATARFEGHFASRALGQDRTHKVLQTAKAHQTTPFVVLWVALAEFLAGETKASDIAVAAGHANRPPGSENQIGCWTKVLPYRLTLGAGGQTLLDQAREKSQQIAAFGDADLSAFAQVAGSGPGQYLSAFTQIAFQYHDFDFSGRENAIALNIPSRITSFFEVSIEWRRDETGLLCAILARADLFEPATLERWLDAYFAKLKPAN